MKGGHYQRATFATVILIAFITACSTGAVSERGDGTTTAAENATSDGTSVTSSETIVAPETGQVETTVNNETILLENHVNDLAMGPDGKLWAATDFGVVSWDVTDGSYVRHDGRNGLTDERYNVMFVASNGAIWTSGDQCATHDGEKWTVFDSCRYATSLVATADGTVAAAIGWNISVYDGNHWLVDRDRDDDPIVTLAPDGSVWALENNRLYSWDGSRWRRPDSLTSNILPQDGELVTITQDGLFWINGHWSLYSYDGLDATHYYLEDVPFPIQDCWSGLGGDIDDVAEEPVDFVIERAAVAPDGIIWIATCRGVASYDDGNWTVHTKAPPAVGALWPSTLLAGPGSQVWVGTYGDGILHYDGEAWQQFTVSE